MPTREEILRELDPFIHYPESDGKPMADNTLQALWIIMLYDNLKILLRDKLAFIAADHFWYPVMGDPRTVIAPDIMVTLGRPSHHRSSYKQWLEENMPPHFVCEVMSPSNTGQEMQKKLQFYQEYGVSEYLILDPDAHSFQAYERLENDILHKVSEGENTWMSSIVDMKISIINGELKAQFPNGEDFKTAEELNELNLNLQNKNTSLQSENTSLQSEIEALKKRLRELGDDV